MVQYYGSERTRRLAHKGGLLLGFLAVLVALTSAYFSPATGYETSLYTATPLLFWIGTGTALIISAIISVRAYQHHVGSVALLLAIAAATSIFSLPLLRGYYFYGHGDPLTHLGWARNLDGGAMAVTDLIYPGNHLIAVFLSNSIGIHIRHSVLLVTVLLKLVYVLFIPLSLYTLYRNRKVLFLGTYSAILLLPLNSVATHEHFHVFSLTLLFIPVIFYILFKHITYDYRFGKLPFNITPLSFLFPIPLAAVVFFHPQVAASLLALLGGFVLLHGTYRIYNSKHFMSQFRGVYGQFLFLGIVLVLWVVQFDHPFRVFNLIVTGIEEIVVGTGETVPAAQEQGESVDRIGISFYGLVVRLFGVSFIYILLATGLVIRYIGGFEQHVKTGGVVRYLTAGGFALVPLVILHLFGDVSVFLFRFIGFGMVVVTILGTIAVYRLSELSVPYPFDDLRAPILVGATIVILLAGLLTVFASPYIFLPNEHVTEAEYEGYGTMFDQRDGDVPVTGIRTHGARFVDAHQAVEVSHGDVPDSVEFEQQLPDVYDSDVLLTVSEHDQVREIDVFRELRYSESGFNQLETTPGVHRVQSNGDTTVYYIEG